LSVRAPTAAASASTFSGVLRDRDGNPLANLGVTLQGATYGQSVTGADGRFAITVAPGTYSIRVTAGPGMPGPGAGIVQSQFDLFGPSIDLSTDRTQDLTLHNLFLDLTVLDPNGRPVSGATVGGCCWSTYFELYPGGPAGGGFGTGGQTDANGHVRLAMFSTASASLLINMPGQPTQVLTVAVMSDTSISFPDRVPPTISAPAAVTVDATSPSGATVDYVVTATDNADPAPGVSCVPPSGSTFAIGATTVQCTATDASGNSAAGTFVVTVRGATAQLASLLDTVNALQIAPGIRESLVSKLRATSSALLSANSTRRQDACGSLTAFVLEVSAQQQVALVNGEAPDLLARAHRIGEVISCSG
jgi:hypothetical protein